MENSKTIITDTKKKITEDSNDGMDNSVTKTKDEDKKIKQHQ